MTVLKLDNIHAGYGSKEVLKGVSLEVSAGEVVALLGPNGAGKSTVLKVIAGLLSPKSGQITYGNHNITRMPTYRRASNGIGYLMQNGPVFKSLTIAEHQRLAKLNELKPVVSIPPGKCGGVLSGGERQSVAVAIEVALEIALKCKTEPRLLLLDEPSAGLSWFPEIAKDIYNQIRQRIADTETAVLVTEHNLRFLVGFAHRVIIMRHGEIHRDEFPPTDLANSEAVFEAFYGGIVLTQ